MMPPCCVASAQQSAEQRALRSARGASARASHTACGGAVWRKAKEYDVERDDGYDIDVTRYIMMALCLVIARRRC